MEIRPLSLINLSILEVTFFLEEVLYDLRELVLSVSQIV